MIQDFEKVLEARADSFSKFKTKDFVILVIGQLSVLMAGMCFYKGGMVDKILMLLILGLHTFNLKGWIENRIGQAFCTGAITAIQDLQDYNNASK